MDLPPGDRGARPCALGGQAEWCFAIPWAYRALASPSTGEPMLAAPAESDPHEQRRAYWTSLLHMLCFRLGWASPERGLAWWEKAGFPVADATLALVATTWLPDGRLPLLRDWLAARDAVCMPGIVDPAYCQMHPDADREPRPEPRPDAWDSPGGLHLEYQGGHVAGPLMTGECSRGHPPTLLAGSPSSRRAVLTTPCMLGWYAVLAELGAALPGLGQSSWRVEVYVQPVGHLGTFRRSRDTGAWFTGRHSVHVAGC